jgi:hypothetical protein
VHKAKDPENFSRESRVANTKMECAYSAKSGIGFFMVKKRDFLTKSSEVLLS